MSNPTVYTSGVQALGSSPGLAGALVEQAAKRPQQTAIVFEDKRCTYSYAGLYARSQAIAAQLLALGIKRQDKVGVLFPNDPEFIATFFAVSGLGAIVVPINPMLKSDEIAHILTDSGAKALVCHHESLAEALRALPNVRGLERILVAGPLPSGLNEDTFAPPLAVSKLTNALQPPQAVPFVGDIDVKRELSMIVYTSGTTGKPKGAMLTHHNIMSVIPDSLLGPFSIDHNDRCLGILPLCHIYGICVIMYGCIARGSTVVMMRRFEAKSTLATIQQEKVTIVPAVPALYQFMLMEMANAKYDLSSVRICFSGAAPLSQELSAAIGKGFGAPLIEGYALTETCCGATITPLALGKVGSVGKPVPGIDVTIKADDGRTLPAGADNVGEIAIKGENVMIGYHNHPEATAEVMHEGWFLSGDLGYRDDEGYFYIVGRKKELIIRGGQNIYPREVEDVIATMPGVREVAVIGVPDQFMGERVKAIVVLLAGTTYSEDDVKMHCDKHLAQYKVPRLVEFRSDLLPRNPTGKVLKRLLS